MAVFLGIPVAYWLVGAGSAAAATVVTAKVDDTAQGVADAVERTAKPISKLIMTTAIVGAGILAYRHREAIGAFIASRKT